MLRPRILRVDKRLSRVRAVAADVTPFAPPIILPPPPGSTPGGHPRARRPRPCGTSLWSVTPPSVNGPRSSTWAFSSPETCYFAPKICAPASPTQRRGTLEEIEPSCTATPTPACWAIRCRAARTSPEVRVVPEAALSSRGTAALIRSPRRRGRAAQCLRLEFGARHNLRLVVAPAVPNPLAVVLGCRAKTFLSCKMALGRALEGCSDGFGR